MSPAPGALRLDKWLWHARFFRSRSAAARAVAEDGLRVNGARVSKPAATVGAGDVLSFVAGRQVRVVRVLGLGSRRGPAAEARALYADLTPPTETRCGQVFGPAPIAGGRPKKRARRVFDAARRDALD